MKTWAEFIPYVSMRLPSCPTFTMEDAAKRAAIEFYNSSRAWRVEGVILGTTVLGQAVYAVTTNPADAELVGLPTVWIANKEVRELVPGEADDYYPGETGTKPGVGVAGVASIRLAPAPDVSGSVIKATVAYRPSLAATGIDDELWHQHREAIENRMLGMLMKDIGKPWSDAKMALFYDSQYDIKALSVGSDAGPVRRTPLRVKLSRY